MRIFLLSAVLAVLLFDPGVRAAHQKMSANPIAQALIWQARQYTHIKTIHFLAIAHHIHTTTNGKTRTFKSRYEFWGAGIKYRIESFSPHAEIDNVVTDNGRHYYFFSIIDDVLTIGPTHPTHGTFPFIQNPILEPMVPLVPHYPRRLQTPHVHWMNLARLARNPQSVFNRCRQVRNCGNTGLDGSLRGCLLGAYNSLPAHVRFIIGGKMSHPLVTGWRANVFRSWSAGSYVRLGRIRYRAFRLKSGRKIFLPVGFDLTGVWNKPFPETGPFTIRMTISHVSIDKPIPPGKFTINYKLARVVEEVTGHGKFRKFHYFTVHPTRPVPPRERNLNK